MAALNLRRFSKPETLHSITPEHLITFLAPYRNYFLNRGITLPRKFSHGSLDYTRLSQVLISPDVTTPQSLIDGLFFINELATPASFDMLQQAVSKSDLGIVVEGEMPPADIALQIWVKAPELLESLHAEHFLYRPRSFEYFRSTRKVIPVFEEPGKETLQVLEHSLDEWFVTKGRGRTARILMFSTPTSVWFLVRHGEVLTRTSALKEGESTSVIYRPARFDVLVYNPATGEIRINASGKMLKRVYRQLFGLYFFGDGDFFNGRSKFTLEPLRRDGRQSLVCSDIDGLEWVKLREIHYHWPGDYRETEIRKAVDIFAALESRDGCIPNRAEIAKASFEIRFKDAKTPRMVTISSQNKAQYKRDNDAELIERWMIQRGFINFEKDVQYEDFPLLMEAS